MMNYMKRGLGPARWKPSPKAVTVVEELLKERNAARKP